MIDPLDFETGEDGLVKSYPSCGWNTAIVANMALLIRLLYYPSKDAALSETPEGIQLVLTPQQCRELAQVLLQKADQLSAIPDGTTSQ